MFVQVYDRFKSRIKTPLQFRVERYTADVTLGGPASLTISVSGSRANLALMRDWLGGYIKVFNSNLTPVWWGKLDAVTSYINGQRRTFTLSDLRNRVRALYTFTDGAGVTYPSATFWAEHNESITNYGVIEEQRSVGETTGELAAAARDTALEWLHKPGESFGVVRQVDGGQLKAVSLYATLNQTYARRADGRQVYMGEPTADLKFGWGYVSNAIGFADKAMHTVDGGLDFIDEDDKIQISGSASNNGVKTVFMPVEGKPESYTFGDIAFNGIDDIDSVAGNLGFVRKGVFIHIAGSDFNDGYHLTDNPGREHVTTDQNVTGDIITENGLPITFKQGHTARIAEGITTEIPGANITLKYVGEKLIYFFTMDTAPVAWEVAEIWLRLRKENVPIDSVQVDLHAAPGGVVGALLESSTVPASAILLTFNWVKFAFDNTASLTPGATYAMVISRTGALDAYNFYYTEIDENLGHTGNLGLWNGAGWVGRPQGNASIPFQVWGHKSTTEQISQMLATNNQYFTQIKVNANSSMYTRQYRDGNSFVDVELDSLLNPGASAVRLLPKVTQDWHLLINPVPSSSDIKYMIRGRTLVNRNGKPLEDGILPVGEWCIVEGENDKSAFLLGYLEYNPGSNEITDIRAIDAPDPWSMVVRQG